jgi:hypothetical protein
MIDQIQLAQGSIFMYAGLPVFSEWLIEEGYTRVYYRYIPACIQYLHIHMHRITYCYVLPSILLYDYSVCALVSTEA